MIRFCGPLLRLASESLYEVDQLSKDEENTPLCNTQELPGIRPNRDNVESL